MDGSDAAVIVSRDGSLLVVGRSDYAAVLRRSYATRDGGMAQKDSSRWDPAETLLVIWSLVALVSLVLVSTLLDASFPALTVVWVVVPLVVVLSTRDASRVGIRPISWRLFLQTTALYVSLLLLVTVLVEPWSHAYEGLLRLALESPHPDTTFVWLVRFSPPWSLAGMASYSGLTTLFAEELFFRGWLLGLLRKRIGSPMAILLQSLLFLLPNLIAAYFMPPLQGTLYAVVYSWLAVGVGGGWAASRTQSIWPSLVFP